MEPNKKMKKKRKQPEAGQEETRVEKDDDSETKRPKLEPAGISLSEISLLDKLHGSDPLAALRDLDKALQVITFSTEVGPHKKSYRKYVR